jgi:mannitol/fructose-specific phosphotransferase system IIA component (Ntr-type)
MLCSDFQPYVDNERRFFHFRTYCARPPLTKPPLKPVQTLANFTNTLLLRARFQSTASDKVIAELCVPLCQELGLGAGSNFFEAVMAREKLCSTACEPGWALPHARLASVPHLSFALGRADSPLAWFGAPKLGVRLVWLFAVPEFEARSYLNLVASVAKLSQNPVFLEQLMRAPDAAAMLAVLKQVPVRGVQASQPALSSS